MSSLCYKLYTYKSPQLVLLDVSPPPPHPNFLVLCLGSRQFKSVEGRIFKCFLTLYSTMRDLQGLNSSPRCFWFLLLLNFSKELEDISGLNNGPYSCQLSAYELFIRLSLYHYFGWGKKQNLVYMKVSVRILVYLAWILQHNIESELSPG